MISQLTLTNFRNHNSLRINTDGAKNIIITGKNGSGKTAILEAVSMLSGDRGLRGAQMDEIIRFGANNFAIHSSLIDDTELSVSFSAGDSNRHCKIDGDNAPLSDLASQLRIVWLTPKEDRLFIDGASDRRAFFDRLVANFDSAHLGRVARLSKLLSERAFALKNNADDEWLFAIEKQIASTAIAISAARIQYVGRINYFLTSAAMSVSGIVEKLIHENSASHAEEKYLDYLTQNHILSNDKMIVDGAHKSDFSAFNNILNLPVNITSTGQQKSILIDLILAHTKLIKKSPLILLDEADAHLDASARKRIFNELKNTDATIWATGIERDSFTYAGDTKFIELTINNG